MVKAIPMEDWLRGCIYHEGRHGYVTLPIDKVHQIANYIQRTRRSGTDGMIDLEVVEADRKTEPQTGRVMLDGYKLIMSLNDWWYSSFGYEETEESKAIKKVIDKVEKYVEQAEQTEPQTEIKVEPTWVGTTYGRFEDEPQTDCSWK